MSQRATARRSVDDPTRAVAGDAGRHGRRAARLGHSRSRTRRRRTRDPSRRLDTRSAACAARCRRFRLRRSTERVRRRRRRGAIGQHGGVPHRIGRPRHGTGDRRARTRPGVGVGRAAARHGAAWSTRLRMPRGGRCSPTPGCRWPSPVAPAQRWRSWVPSPGRPVCRSASTAPGARGSSRTTRAAADRFASAVEHSLDRKVCNTLNVCCIVRDRAAELVPIASLAAARAAGSGVEPTPAST